MTSDSLRQQLDFYHQQVEDWKIAHEEAMFCGDIEDAIAIGLTILENIRRRTEKWAQEVERSGREFSWDDVHGLAEQYRCWLEVGSQALAAIEACEARSYQVEGADRFRTAYADVSLMSLDTDRVRHSLESLDEGRGIPSDRAMNELRHHLRR